MTDLIPVAHAVTVRYRGATNTRGAYWALSWPRWESGSTVRRKLPYQIERDDVAREAARMLCDWLNEGPGREVRPETVTYGTTGPDAFVVLIRTTVS